MTKHELEYWDAVSGNEDRWVRASGGTEEPFFKDGKKYLYVYNPALRKHAYLDVGSDIILSEVEEMEVFG